MQIIQLQRLNPKINCVTKTIISDDGAHCMPACAPDCWPNNKCYPGEHPPCGPNCSPCLPDAYIPCDPGY